MKIENAKEYIEYRLIPQIREMSNSFALIIGDASNLSRIDGDPLLVAFEIGTIIADLTIDHPDKHDEIMERFKEGMKSKVDELPDEEEFA